MFRVNAMLRKYFIIILLNDSHSIQMFKIFIFYFKQFIFERIADSRTNHTDFFKFHLYKFYCLT